MTRYPLAGWALSIALALAGCGDRASVPSPGGAAQTAPGEAAAAHRARAEASAGPAGAEPLDWSYLDTDGVLELDWLQMLPADEIETLSRPPPVRHLGTTQMEQHGSDRVVPAVLGFPVRIPGYVVPLETDERGRVSELFLVPYYGACIHVPPPPPNQIIHVRLATPTEVPDIYEAYWIEGELRGEATRNEIAGTAYSMQDARLRRYDSE